MRTSIPRDGACLQCRLPVALHFDAANRTIGCRAARRRARIEAIVPTGHAPFPSLDEPAPRPTPPPALRLVHSASRLSR